MGLNRKQLRRLIRESINELTIVRSGKPHADPSYDGPLPYDTILDDDVPHLQIPLDDAIEKEAAYANVRITPGMTYSEIINAIEASTFQLTPDMGMPSDSPDLARIKELVAAYGSENDVFRDGQAVYDRFVRR